jgi:hypothetical protein
MTDRDGTDGEAHEARVREAFDALHRCVGPRLDERSRGTLEGIRTAASRRDAEGLRRELTAAQTEHGWLYRELAEHPAVANLLNELALWGF